jgi:hypothetical protein
MELKDEIFREILQAMDDHIKLAYYLINKIATETKQKDIEEIGKGKYWMIENTGEELSENWIYDVHGEHCNFWNNETGQNIEVSLGENKFIENLDPYFFYKFIKTSEKYKHLIKYFQENPFNKMIS